MLEIGSNVLKWMSAVGSRGGGTYTNIWVLFRQNETAWKSISDGATMKTIYLLQGHSDEYQQENVDCNVDLKGEQATWIPITVDKTVNKSLARL
jgi:hypothetical protein